MTDCSLPSPPLLHFVLMLTWMMFVVFPWSESPKKERNYYAVGFLVVYLTFSTIELLFNIGIL